MPAPSHGRVIAVLGAERAATTDLACGLLARLAQHGIAASQCTVVVVDGTALMLAVGAERQFGDASLHAEALAAQRAHALTLLAAPDPTAASDQARHTDLQLRAALSRTGLSYAVIHGRAAAERLDNAWNAIRPLVDGAEPAAAAEPAVSRPGGWSWSCDKCSDPVCEHRLFSALLAGRG